MRFWEKPGYVWMDLMLLVEQSYLSSGVGAFPRGVLWVASEKNIKYIKVVCLG